MVNFDFNLLSSAMHLVVVVVSDNGFLEVAVVSDNGKKIIQICYNMLSSVAQLVSDFFRVSACCL